MNSIFITSSSCSVFLQFQNNAYVQPLARCLQFLLRRNEYRTAFISANGVHTLLQILSKEINFQVQYQLIFCIWILTFSNRFAENFPDMG